MSSDVRKIIDPGTPYSRTLKYSIDEKLAIISHAKNHGNRAAGREFNVAESSIREWRKNESKLIYNKTNLAAGLAATASSSSTSSSPHPSLSASHNQSNNNNNNNNNLQNKNGNYPPSLPQNPGIFRSSLENNGVVPRRNPEDIVKLQLVQLAMMNMDFTHLAPLIQLQHHQRLLQAAAASSQAPPIPQPHPEPASTSSSVAGTPSSISSSSTPPPSLSPTQSGSGRRKPKCPQKIVEVLDP
ncbi:hypothetical protein L3Y34_010013 [Caenorhabditis briggsae]|uniref:HTH psq-type domain-containing protein n=1 Tax=Caenorhabditis briggsae TaxID=6238 RepID=A0AAE9ABE2_CAEBR|nr:hypothetical protein L3Y34_010013 [Caenorhabditis briggsae]